MKIERPVNIELADMGPYPTILIEEYATNSVDPRNVIMMHLSPENGHRVVRASPLPKSSSKNVSPFLFLNGGDTFVALIPNDKFTRL